MSGHYFSESPESELRPREIRAVLGGAERSVRTAGGVFSPEHLDRGTEVLLRTLADAPPAGRVLDIGCGWGPIALDAALTASASGLEAEVWGVDVNERARALAAENARSLGLAGVRIASPEEVPAELRFDEIRSNPPIRVGKAALHEILGTWLPRLAPGGSAYLVVAKHLGADSLQRWIGEAFPELAVDRMARDKGFHVLRARQV
ncbi:class I SAM-dependent methyltransferase [Leucobacter sp. HNU]|uniref:class I SAM-dependent methyltransferase n=1 Tax=Leucobacter sp. HNU TaxID=3236805 RepID=UPI003A8100D3